MTGEEMVRGHVMRATADERRHLVELDDEEAWELLGSVGYGRIVFSQNALPAIRPVNHLIDNRRIILKTRLTTRIGALVGVRSPTVVAYEADELDPHRRVGWSVVATGYATPITDPAEAQRLEAALTPWVDMTTDSIIAIRPEIITGYRLTAH